MRRPAASHSEYSDLAQRYSAEMGMSGVLIALAIVCSASVSAAQQPDVSAERGPIPAATPRPNYRECFLGSAAGCIAEARRSLEQPSAQPVDAIALFAKACELGEPVGCDEVARLYQAGNDPSQAQSFVERGRALRRAQMLSVTARRAEGLAAPIVIPSPERMRILENRVDASLKLTVIGGISLGIGVVLSLAGLGYVSGEQVRKCILCGIVLPGIGGPQFALPGVIMLGVGVTQLRRNKQILAAARNAVAASRQEPTASSSASSSRAMGPTPIAENSRAQESVEFEETPLTRGQIEGRLRNAKILTGIGVGVLAASVSLIVGGALAIYYRTDGSGWYMLGFGSALVPAAIPMLAVGGHRLGVYRERLAARDGTTTAALGASASIELRPVLTHHQWGLSLSGRF